MLFQSPWNALRAILMSLNKVGRKHVEPYFDAHFVNHKRISALAEVDQSCQKTSRPQTNAALMRQRPLPPLNKVWASYRSREGQRVTPIAFDANQSRAFTEMLWVQNVIRSSKRSVTMVEKSHTSGFWPSLYDPVRQMGKRLSEWLAPASEASGDDNCYRITIELPGVPEDNIHLTVEDGTVILSGEKQTVREEHGETWYFSERQYGSFSRSFRLPPDAKSDAIDAHLKDGVLTVTIPKTTPKQNGTEKVQIRKG